MKNSSHRAESGFTLIELLIVLVFISILSSVGIGYYFNYYRQTILKSAAETVGSFLYVVQQKSIGQEETSQWGVHFENPIGTDKPFYASFKGATYAAPVEKIFLDNALDFEYPADGTSVDIVFNKITGKPSDNAYKKVYLKLASGEGAKGIRVTPTGVISVDDAEIGWWKMDEGSGTLAIDSSIYRSNAAFTGSPIWNTEANCRGSGKCLTFSSGNYLTIGDVPQLKITGNQTIAMWLRPTSFATRQNPYAKAYGGEGTITQEPSGNFNYYYGTGGGNTSPYQGFGSGTITINQWSHIALVRDLTAMKLYWYINGKLSTTTNASYPAAVVSTLPAYIGHGYTTDYVGEIDDVRVYDRALSAAEIARIYELTR